MAANGSKRVDTKELRTFGLSLGTVCLVWLAVLAWKGHGSVWPWLVGAAVVLAGLALAAPAALRPLHRVWMPVAHGVARVLTWLLLTIVYYVVFTPYGAILRLLGKDPLERRLEPERASYWISRKDGPFDPTRTSKPW